MWIARDAGSGSDDNDYWIALEPMDSDSDSEGRMFVPYGGKEGPARCASIGSDVWKALGGPAIEPGSDQVEMDVQLVITPLKEST